MPRWRETPALRKPFRGKPLAALGFLLFLSAAGVPGARAQTVPDDVPVPTSVSELYSTLEQALRVDPTRPSLLPAPPSRKPQLSYNIRTYYYDRHDVNNSENEAWALGGNVNYWSDYFHGVFGISAQLFTSQPLHAPKDKGGTPLLTVDQEPITVLGQANARIKFGSERLTLYRQALNLPYVNKSDSGMIPNEFEAYRISHVRLKTLNYVLSYVDKIKPKVSPTFESMSKVAGAPTDKGMWLAGLEHNDRKFDLSAFNEYVPDTFNTFFTEANYKHQFGNGRSLGFGLQYSNQTSVGDDLLIGSPFHTDVLFGRLAYSARDLLLTMAGSTTARGAPIRSPYGKYPGSVLMQLDFNRAGEDAVEFTAAYDFTSRGADGVKLFLGYGYGSGAINPATGRSLPNATEFDVTADWRPKKGRWKNYWLRLRYSEVHFIGGATGGDGYQPELRLILNYDANLL